MGSRVKMLPGRVRCAAVAQAWVTLRISAVPSARGTHRPLLQPLAGDPDILIEKGRPFTNTNGPFSARSQRAQ